MIHTRKIWLALTLMLVLCNISFAQNNFLKTNEDLPKEKPIFEDKNEISDISKVIDRSSEPSESDWLTTDVKVHAGDVNHDNFRQLDMKQGPDGLLYIVVNGKHVSPYYSGTIFVYKSNDGGSTWSLVKSIQPMGYVSSVSMLVANTDPDPLHAYKTTIFVYYTASTTSDYYGSKVRCYRMKRDGSEGVDKLVASPGAGYRFMDVSACSEEGYAFHVVAQKKRSYDLEPVGILHSRTRDWGESYVNAILEFKGWHPSCAYYGKSSPEKICIAVQGEEEVGTSTSSSITLLFTDRFPTSVYSKQKVASSLTSVYSQPCLTIVQNGQSDPSIFLISCLKDGKPVYHYTINGGSTWNKDRFLSTSSAYNTWCTSYRDGTYLIAYTKSDGKISMKLSAIREGFVIPSYYDDVNSYASISIVAPVCAIRRSGSQNISCLVYGASNPRNVYFDAKDRVSNGLSTGSKNGQQFALGQNYPNPFNPATSIKYAVPFASNVTIKVYDIAGREVMMLLNEFKETGVYQVTFDGTNLTSGVYFYKITTQGFTDIKRMMLIK